MKYRNLIVVLCFVIPGILVSACSPSWSAKLAEVDEEDWGVKDRLGFLMDSPWVHFERAPVKGWSTQTQVNLDVTASWVSPYFRANRRAILARLTPLEAPPFLEYVANTFTHVAQYRRTVSVAGKSPYPLTHRLIVATPLLGDGLGVWPTGVEAARDAHRQLYMLPFPDVDLQQELDERTSLSDTITLDLVLTPVMLRHRARPGDPDIDDCLAMLLGQLAARGTVLVRQDGEMRFPKRVVVLSHDIDHQWEYAAWRMASESRVVVAAPAVVRLHFDRRDEGSDWLHADSGPVALRLETPRETAEICAENPKEGLLFEVELTFDPKKMMVIGPSGL